MKGFNHNDKITIVRAPLTHRLSARLGPSNTALLAIADFGALAGWRRSTLGVMLIHQPWRRPTRPGPLIRNRHQIFHRSLSCAWLWRI